MTLSCECDYDGDYDWYFEKPTNDYDEFKHKRRKRCVSCKELIDVGSTAVCFPCWRHPNSDIEEDIYGDEVPLADKWMCETCGDLYWSLEELGFCITLGENMRDMVKEYADTYNALCFLPSIFPNQGE